MTYKIKTSLVLAAAFCLPLATAQATETGAGCGVGKMVMEGKEGKNANITAALINWVVNVQAFGMTTGTLGCDVSQTVSNEHAKETFVASNKDNLMIEMAQGQGAHLAALASLLGVATEDQAVFYSTLQQNYSSITSADDMLAVVQQTLQQHPRLAMYAS